MRFESHSLKMTPEKRLLAALLVCLTGLIGLLSQTSLQAQNINSGLKAYWNMDAVSGTTIADQSGNGFDGTLSGNAIISAAGKTGGCLEMPALSDGMMLVSNMNWQPAAPGYAFSVSFWINPYSLTNYSNQVVAYPGWGAFVFHGDATGGIYTGTDVTNRFTPDYFQPNILQTNQWQHFVFTYASGTGSLYRNGVLVTSRTGMVASTAWTGLRIGASSAGSSLHGKIDEVRVYDRAVTAAEVELLRAYPNLPASRVWSTTPVSTDWNNPSNWTGGAVPQEYDNVTVNSCTTCPALTENVNVNNLTVNTGGKLNIGPYVLTSSKNLLLNAAQISSNSGRLFASNPGSTGTVYTGQITIAKTNPGSIVNSFFDGNTYNGKITFLFTYIPNYTRWFIGTNAKETFNSDVAIEMTGGTGGYYNNIVFGSNGNQLTEINGNLSIRNGGGDLCILYVNGVKVNQATDIQYNGPQGGKVYFYKNCEFVGPVSFNVANVAKYHCYLQFVPNGAAYQQIFRKPVTLTAGSNNNFWTNAIVQFGDGTGGVRFEPEATLSVSGSSVRWSLTSSKSTFTPLLSSSTARTVTIPPGPATSNDLYVGLYLYGTTFEGKANITSPHLYLGGNQFKDEVKLTKTGSGTDASQGGNIFRKKVTITNNAPAGSNIQMATTSDDIIQQSQ